jgi:Phage tail protein (Tail_P2_I)
MPLDSAPLTATRPPMPAPHLDPCLLPRRSSTPYMRAMSAAMAIPLELKQAVRRVGDIKREIPDAAIPFLLWEYGLEPVAAWVPDAHRLLTEGRAWQRIRGTPASIDQALSWIDLTARLEQSADTTWWDLFQLEFAHAQPMARLEAASALARLSKQAHTDLIRVYNRGYDLRALQINGPGKINGGCMINDWSGRWVRPDWPKVSFLQVDQDRFDFTASPRPTRSIESISEQHRTVYAWGFRVNGHRINGGEKLQPQWSRSTEVVTELSRSDFSRRGRFQAHLRFTPEQRFGTPPISTRSAETVIEMDRCDASGRAVRGSETVIERGRTAYDPGRFTRDRRFSPTARFTAPQVRLRSQVWSEPLGPANAPWPTGPWPAGPWGSAT